MLVLLVRNVSNLNICFEEVGKEEVVDGCYEILYKS